MTSSDDASALWGRRHVCLRAITTPSQHGLMTSPDPPDEPPPWLHDRIMTALAPGLAELRQAAEQEDIDK